MAYFFYGFTRGILFLHETERQLIKKLRRDCTGKTFIFITHHPAVAEACEATIQL